MRIVEDGSGLDRETMVTGIAMVLVAFLNAGNLLRLASNTRDTTGPSQFFEVQAATIFVAKLLE
jgi:hypothetical protein